MVEWHWVKLLCQYFVCLLSLSFPDDSYSLLLYVSNKYIHVLREYYFILQFITGRLAQSVQRLATGWTVRGSNPGGGEIFRTCPDRAWGPPSLLYNGHGSFPGVKSGRGVTLTPHPLLVPCSKKGRAIPLLPLWAVRPVQGCTLPLPYLTNSVHCSVQYTICI